MTPDVTCRVKLRCAHQSFTRVVKEPLKESTRGGRSQRSHCGKTRRTIGLYVTLNPRCVRVAQNKAASHTTAAAKPGRRKAAGVPQLCFIPRLHKATPALFLLADKCTHCGSAYPEPLLLNYTAMCRKKLQAQLRKSQYLPAAVTING